MPTFVANGPDIPECLLQAHEDGRVVKVVGGSYWGTDGLSNHWTFREVLTDGSLGPKEYGYGYVLVGSPEGTSEDT